MDFTTFNFPTTIHFGCGVRKKLVSDLKARGFKRPLLVTDKSVSQLTFFKEIGADLEKNHFPIRAFWDFEGNPLERHVNAGLVAYRNHEADSILAIGGGAVMDVAKAISIVASHPRSLFEYEDKPTARPIDGPVPLIAAVPTTAGTGSEVGRSTVISDDNTRAKRILFSPKLLPVVVFADPEVTLDLPPKITAATGMDALTHCVEAFIAKDYHPPCEGIALEGVRLIARALPRAVKNGSDIEARKEMLCASMMGAMAFQKGLGIVHSAAHALSTVHDFHHGLANALMIPFGMEFNVSACKEKMGLMAEAVGRDRKNPESFIEWLYDLRREIGIPEKLSLAAIQNLEGLVEVAWNDPCHANNPRKASRDDIQKIYERAL